MNADTMAAALRDDWEAAEESLRALVQRCRREHRHSAAAAPAAALEELQAGRPWKAIG